MSNKSLALIQARSIDGAQPLSKRLTQAVSYGLTGGWFSPSAPLLPQHPETAGRALDYLAGYNLSTQPRRDSGIDFYQLRNFAQYYDILRLIIETRKDQVVSMDWAIVPSEKEAGQGLDDETKAKIDRATQFFKSPDGRMSWHAWVRKMMEDILVLDAVAYWPVYKGNELLRLESVDPVTIKKVIDESGRTPEPPLPAYQQIIKGVPASEYTSEELFYFQRNSRNGAIYGFGPVEQALMTINIGLRREVSQLQFFTEGNIPEAIAGVPENWTMTQIAQFQSYWDAMLEGNTGARRHMKFIPADASKVQFLKDAEATLKTDFDEWIVKVICYAFSVSHQPFVSMMNRATAQTAKEEAREEGLGPTLDYVKEICDFLITRLLGLEGVEFKWQLEQEEDPQTQSTIDDLYIRNGVWSIDEVRQRMGLEPVGVGNMIWTGSGPIPVKMFADGTAVQALLSGGAKPPESSDKADEKADDVKDSARDASAPDKGPERDTTERDTEGNQVAGKVAKGVSRKARTFRGRRFSY